jgi:NADH:ubiquinone reductase (H+-translocating)
MSEQLPHVVILGAGFGGLEAAKALRKTKVRVTVVDKRNHHLFQPLLYQVATAALSAPDIAAPIRKILSNQRNTTVLMARAKRIDAAGKALELIDGQRLPYDYLIVASGMTNDYFGHDEWETHAPGLKSLEEALDIRRRVLLAYESAEREQDAAKRKAWLTFIVIGGGATGVELAGALVEIARRTMIRNFRNFDPTEARVVLLEGGERLLAAFPEHLSERAKSDLTKLGVEVRLGARATTIDERGVVLGDERIEGRTVLWGAGVRGVPVAASLGVKVDRAGRVPVRPDLTVEGLPGVFVIGDAASFIEEGQPLPGVAQVALQGGRQAARNIALDLQKKPMEPFHYTDLGSMATIGRSSAVLSAGKIQIGGFVAWLGWLFVHLMALIGFRNRVAVLAEWCWAYVSYQRSARIILEAPIDAAPPPPAPTPPGALAAASPSLALPGGASAGDERDASTA